MSASSKPAEDLKAVREVDPPPTEIGLPAGQASSTPPHSVGSNSTTEDVLLRRIPFPVVLEAGRTVDRFRLEEKLGQGAFGEVWRCSDPLLSRPVAIKFARPVRQFTCEGVELVHEARKVSRLSHPGIVHVYDLLADGAQFAIVSELIDGQTLKDRLSKGTLPISEVVSIIRDVAAGLQHAHQADLLHRDVKPSNILLRRNGSAALTDFGLAASEVQLEHMASGTSGTLLFMSPEQARGDVELLDNRSDLFCLGIVLFHCLTGKFPYPQARNQAKYREYVAKRLAKPLRAVDASLPKALDAICSRCLALAPRDRYHSAQDLVDDLDAFLVASGPEPSRRPERPRWWLPVGIAGCATAAVVLAFASLQRSAPLAVATPSPGDASPPIVPQSPVTPQAFPATDSSSPPVNTINLVNTPEIFAWPFSDSRGIPQHTPETQTYSFRSEKSPLLAVCGQSDTRELKLQAEFSLRCPAGSPGSAGLIWALRKNPNQTEPPEFTCYAAEFFRPGDEARPLLILSELILRPIDEQEMQIPHRRELITVDVQSPATQWTTLKIIARPGQVDVMLDSEVVLSSKNLPADEKAWIPPGTSSAGIIGRGAMVAFRHLQPN